MTIEEIIEAQRAGHIIQFKHKNSEKGWYSPTDINLFLNRDYDSRIKPSEEKRS